MNPVIVACDMTTAYGEGIGACWDGLLSNTRAIRKVTRFSTQSFHSSKAGIVEGLQYKQDASLAVQLLEPLFRKHAAKIPPDALVILATTVGEIDLLERSVLEGTGNAELSRPALLLDKVKGFAGLEDDGMVISNACASSSTAIGFAAGLIDSGNRDCVLVVAVDAVTEFVFSGFSSLMALDPDTAKPFDKNRAGLSLGEGAGFVLLMKRERAEKEGHSIMGEVAGWAVSEDANHMTGPSREGVGLRLSIQKALKKAGLPSGEVGAISSHGTGTVYNDSMEMKAYNAVFADRMVPIYSIKGALGHTMGAAGLIETVIALEVLKKRIIPSTVGLTDIDPEAAGWVSCEKRSLDKQVVLINNAGFGGVNASLVIKP